MTMYDEQHFTRDKAVVEFDDSADGITTDDDGDVQFYWDEVPRVTVDNPPHADAFESKEFYKIPATVAKPIPQPYQYGEDSVWLKKPREELKKAAWSLDNAPWTMGHPDNGMVKDVDDVRGFWDNARYIDSLDDLDADLHVPVGDEEAKEYVERNSDVSVGFYNRIARVDAYDGVVGGADDESVEVEGYQTDMLFDHCASVQVGRCPGSKGCGIDAGPHGHVSVVDADAFKRGTRIMDKNDEADGANSEMPESTTDQPSGIKTADGQWFAVGPGEHTKGSTDHPGDQMYPVDNCGDIGDAWNLRESGEDLEISEDTLAQRIVRAAEAKDCTNVPDTLTEQMDSEPEESEDCGCTESNTDMEFNFDDLSTEAALAKVSAQHDGVDERLGELEEAEETAEAAQDAADELEIEDVTDLADAVSMREDRIEELEAKVDELQRPQMEEDAAFIAENTDRFGDDAEAVMEELDEDPETVSDKRELVEDLVGEYDEATANSGTDSEDDGGSTDTSGKYATTPWE